MKSKRLKKAIILFSVFGMSAAHSAVVITASTQGADVVFVSNGGSLNLDAFSAFFDFNYSGRSVPSGPAVALSSGTSKALDVYYSAANFITPANFGTAGTKFADSGSATTIYGAENGAVYVPDDYISEAPLPAASMTFNNENIVSMGLTPGTYVWSWGAGSTADSVTLNVVPEPSSLLLIGLGATALLYRRKV